MKAAGAAIGSRSGSRPGPLAQLAPSRLQVGDSVVDELLRPPEG
jgi:hypothetical protein